MRSAVRVFSAWRVIAVEEAVFVQLMSHAFGTQLLDPSFLIPASLPWPLPQRSGPLHSGLEPSFCRNRVAGGLYLYLSVYQTRAM